MKKILYLHGLESKAGGPKVEYLATQGAVFAPEMDYKNPQLKLLLDTMYQQFKPEIVIGSSMGGYAASYLATRYNVDTIMFNPALHSRSFDPVLDFVPSLDSDNKTIVVLGYTDEVIDPITTLGMLSLYPKVKIVRGQHGHRTPLSVFIDIYDKYNFNEL